MGTDFLRLHRDVCFGESGGKIIWQPRIACWYTDKRFAGEALPEPFTGMDLPEIYRELNCSARIYDYTRCFRPVEHPASYQTKRELNETDTEFTIHTPVGRQVSVIRRTPNSPSTIQLKWEIESEEEMRVATWRAENRTWVWDEEAFADVYRKWGQLGAPTMYILRVTVQDLFIQTMGVENAIYGLYDWPDTVETYFRALNECQERLIDVINASPVEIINFGDNLHAGTLSPSLFQKYVLPVYQQRCEKLHAVGKFVHSHWDGDTKALLPFAQETGLDGIEAVTPKPQGDVTLEEIKAALGDNMFLLDGIPAILFDDYSPVSMLEDYTYRLIELFAPNLILGISDELSSTGDIERVRLVGRIVDDYNRHSCSSTS